MKLQKNGYLAPFGVVGLYKLPVILGAFDNVTPLTRLIELFLVPMICLSYSGKKGQSDHD